MMRIRRMHNAITDGDILAFDRRGQCSLFLRSVQKSKKMVMGNSCGESVGLFQSIILPWPSAPCSTGFLGVPAARLVSLRCCLFFCSALCRGIGNINYGLTMRYLGMSMGVSIAIGISLIVGTLMTPIVNGNFDV
ncbi:L-rhamnose/proton symporter RhaT [Shigella flexneri]